ncbi:DnaJ-domain-containing protein [Periconia macrospinosa]|uniref:DnaJ-domain-containing protein n=1 Tax=Periconia macrospinosa TaxID=97972 RepID=A0A2V1E906_9PLEO|nr:DnaJ-domain-containing protein [Periconia macrospinosa]
MGAQQSTADAGAASAQQPVKTSYYELLSVERTATDEEIKKAYRRKALELHPDRNYGDTDRTTALFAEIQSAYQVLSDPQERAWYDAHEGDILRGGEGGAGDEHYEYNMRVTTADDISRMMGKFRANIDFSDSPNGFFGFVRETFEQLAREEAHAADYEGVSIPEYPSFGHKADTHDDVVRDFYAIWNGFATVKTFAWMDVYRTTDATDRRMRRVMEKENKRHREEGIRVFNDAVRTLVAFVRKRDPRYTPNTMSPEEAAKAQRQANKARAAKARAANAAKLQSEQEDAVPDWSKTRDAEDLVEESEEEVEESLYECVACHKTFKSERQYDAHEKSKKHQKAIQALKRQMQKDDARLNLPHDSPTDNDTVTAMSADGQTEDMEVEDDDSPASPIDQATKNLDTIHISQDGESIPHTDEDDDSDPKKEEKDTQPPSHSSATEGSSTDDEDDEYASRSDIEARLASYRKPANAPDIHNDDDDDDKTTSPPATAATEGKKLGAAAKKRAKKAAAAAAAQQQPQSGNGDEGDGSSAHKCVTCHAGFPSKTRLFQHLKESKHAAPIAVTKGGAGSGGKKGKKR